MFSAIVGLPHFEKSGVYADFRKYRSNKLSAIHVPVWCHWVTRNTTQALVLAQINYWFGVIQDATNAKSDLPRTLFRGNFVIDERTSEYRCLIISHQELARQCCLTVARLRTALRFLEENQLLQSTLASEAIHPIKIAKNSHAEPVKSGVKCYRFDSGGVAEALISYLRDMQLISADELVDHSTPLAWTILKHKLNTQVATNNRLRGETSDDVESGISEPAWLGSDPPTSDTTPTPEAIPDHSVEFVGSPLQQMLFGLETWVTVPHWSIAMVHRNLNEAFVLSRIYQWQPYLRRIHEGHLWLEKTHLQLAAEIGMLAPGLPRNRYRRVTRALNRLEEEGLITKLPPKKSSQNRYTRIRLMAEELQRRWNLIQPDNWLDLIGEANDEPP